MSDDEIKEIYDSLTLEELRYLLLCREALLLHRESVYQRRTPKGLCPKCHDASLIKDYWCPNCGYDPSKKTK